MLHSEKLGQRTPAPNKLADQGTVGVPLELNEVPAGGEGGYYSLRARDYAAVPAGGVPSRSTDGLAINFDGMYEPAATAQAQKK